ncbi:hypothetical protein DFH07DRAFT_964111 [Mycena maculata]|uniref:CxC2-like cysteine cluster KDZ transposase-associated domain-containing protein n=1 Tax=Mycena maculata TaxID=230809 RepID=A0AAD7N328_9AGAR|nr:hypothetical protein DFH07DRAFT_964111 [Mycena maculata]
MSYTGFEHLNKKRKANTEDAARRARGMQMQIVGPSTPLEQVEVVVGHDGERREKKMRREDTTLAVDLKPMPKKKKAKKDKTAETQTETAKLLAEFMYLMPYLIGKVVNANEADAAMEVPGEKIGDRVAQLLNARLFPCTFSEPKSAITFNALKQFQIHHLESKVAAFDYCGSLRRLSDNAFTSSVPDMYENFIRCSHMWGVLVTQIRTGQAHGIGALLPHRPANNTMVYCPTCPEPGFNMDQKMLVLPAHLKHLNQQRDTIDGNFHCTKSNKNSDPNDRSLYKGAGFFPTDEDLNEHLAKVPKSNCNYLKAVNNQDKKKFKNMPITGIVNIQCSHVFIKASVDLQLGERYANVDLALARAIRQKLAEGYKGDVQFRFEVDSIDQVGSYDAACQYSVNVISRFEEYFPDVDKP